MTAVPSIDPARLLHEQLDTASPDLLRHLLATFIHALMSGDVDVVLASQRVPSQYRKNGFTQSLVDI
jgi:putative transposase